MIVRFRFLRWFALFGALLAGASVFAGTPMLTFLVALLWLATMSLFVRCPTCDKSPYVHTVGVLRMGSIIPERKCSKCGNDFTGR